jgi:aspartate/glutamate racemase
MKVIGWIGDMNWNSSLEYCRLVNKSGAKKLGGFQSARIILHRLGFDETESNEMLRVLPGREPK